MCQLRWRRGSAEWRGGEADRRQRSCTVRRRVRTSFLVWLVVGLAGCSDPVAPHVCAGDQCAGKQSTVWVGEREAFAVDLLLVIDPALADDARLESLVRAFDALPYDRHYGLLGPGDAAPGRLLPAFDTAARCGVPGLAYLATSATCGARANFPGALAPLVACLARSAASAPHRPLEALRVALGGPSPFRRAGQPLWVVIVSGREDESPGPVAEYAEFLEAQVRTPLVSVVAPAAAGRLTALAEAFHDSTRLELTDDWARAIDALRTVGLLRNPCLPADLRDADPSAPGLQPECVVEETGPGGAGGIRALPACGAGEGACHRFGESSFCESGWDLSVERGGCLPPPGTSVRMTCAVGR